MIKEVIDQSGYAMIREKCLLAGMDDYLAKPVHIAHIEEMIVKWSMRMPIKSEKF